MATPGIIPRYPSYGQGWYAPWTPPGLFNASKPQGIKFEPIFFTAADETKEILWPYQSVPIFQVYVYNQDTGRPELTTVGLDADVAYPDTTKYTFHNSGAAGYIVLLGLIDPGSIVEPPPDEVPASISGSPVLPDAVVGEAYNVSIVINGTLPITLSGETGPAWMTIAITDNTVTLTGTPTATETGDTVSFTVDNDFGDPVTFSDTIDVLASAPPPPPTSTIFGAIIGTTDSIDVKIDVCQAMGMDHIRGVYETLSTYTAGQGSNFYDKCVARDMKYLLNVNWNGTTSPTNMFCHDETLYKAKLNLLIDGYGGDTDVIVMFVIENEPNNRGYYGDTAANYIRQLGWAIEVCHARGIKVADGCTHTSLIMQLAGGGGAGGFTDQLITGYNNLRIAGKALDYVNMHANLSGVGGSRKIIESAQYLRDNTGIADVISNEWHIESADPTYVVQAIADSRTAGLIYSIPYGGKCPWVTGKAYPFNCGETLTAMGNAIRNAIALP